MANDSKKPVIMRIPSVIVLALELSFLELTAGVEAGVLTDPVVVVMEGLHFNTLKLLNSNTELALNWIITHPLRCTKSKAEPLEVLEKSSKGKTTEDFTPGVL